MTKPLSDEERVQCTDLFELYQDDAKTVCIDELGKMLRALGRNLSNKEVREIIVRYDKDRSGALSLEEFLKLCEEEMPKPDSEEELIAAFRFFDKDGSGFLDVNELREALTTYGEAMSAEEIEKLFKELDKDGDGKLVYAEFVAMARHEMSGSVDPVQANDAATAPIDTQPAPQEGETNDKDKKPEDKQLNEAALKIQCVQRQHLAKKRADSIRRAKNQKQKDQSVLDGVRITIPVTDLDREASSEPLSEAEIERIKGKFAHYDQDKSGHIDRLELRTLMQDLGLSLSNVEVGQLHAKLDLDNSGTVELSELIVWYPSIVKWCSANIEQRVATADDRNATLDRTIRQLVMIFRVMDADGSGYLDSSELSGALKDAGVEPPADISAFMKSFDVNSDGKLDETEFLRMVAHLAKEPQTAGGIYAHVEYERWLEKLRAQGVKVPRPPPPKTRRATTRDNAQFELKVREMVAAGAGDELVALFDPDILQACRTKGDIPFYVNLVMSNKTNSARMSGPDLDGAYLYRWETEQLFTRDTHGIYMYLEASESEPAKGCIVGIKASVPRIAPIASDEGRSYGIVVDLEKVETHIHRWHYEHKGEKAICMWSMWEGINQFVDTFEVTTDPQMPEGSLHWMKQNSGTTVMWLELSGPCKISWEVKFRIVPRSLEKRVNDGLYNDAEASLSVQEADCSPVLCGADSVVFQSWLAACKINEKPKKCSSALFSHTILCKMAKTIKYSASSEADAHRSDLGAIVKYGGTDCGGHTCIFIAAARNAGLLARECVQQWHVYAEVFVEGAGWMPVAATLKDTSALGQFEAQGFMVSKGPVEKIDASFLELEGCTLLQPGQTPIVASVVNGKLVTTQESDWLYEDVLNAPGEIGKSPGCKFDDSIPKHGAPPATVSTSGVLP